MSTSRDARLAGRTISAVWALTVVSALVAGAPSTAGDAGLMIGGLGMAVGVLMARGLRPGSGRPHALVLATSTCLHAIAAAIAFDAPVAVVAVTIALVATTAGRLLRAADVRAQRPGLDRAHARLAVTATADPVRTALLAADNDILRAVYERCGELDGEDLLREVADELSATAGTKPAPTVAPTSQPGVRDAARIA